MKKQLMCIVACVCVLALAGSASGAVPWLWMNWAAPDNDWATFTNFTDGTNFEVPGTSDPGDYVLLGELWGGPGVYGANQPHIRTAVPSVDFVGLSWMNAGPAEMTIEAGGSLSTAGANGFFIIGHDTPDTDGTLTMNGGELNTGTYMAVGSGASGHGTLLMNGGTINTSTGFFVNSGGPAGSGLVELAGGTVNAASLSIGASGVLNITGGKIVVADAAGDTHGVEFLNIDFHGGLKSFVATFPDPWNAASWKTLTLVNTSTQHSSWAWNTGDLIYPTLKADLVPDSIVNIADFAKLAEGWMDSGL